jgi:2-keto-4-pentenoate hydratase/2-oxohepta-3-ene-1,7-dioic acid hydratase in catechol pathway
MAARSSICWCCSAVVFLQGVRCILSPRTYDRVSQGKFQKTLYESKSSNAQQLLGAADNLPLKTIVNGEVRQDSNTSDLLFGVRKIVSFCSQGTTLQRGSVILTGTPSGVAMGMAVPKWLKDGDVVEVAIGGIGSIKNKMVFR